MKDDPLVTSVATFFAASKNRSYRDWAIARTYSLIQFLQKHQLTKRTILKPGEFPNETTEIRRSVLTEEGCKVIDAGLNKWWKALDRGTPPENTNILEMTLKQLRQSTKAT